ncbi:YeiH family protein [Polymorphobacter multimanifer]|uniref:Putative integral membrane protein (TIGR00698 family) n=1 Tax=Polymorphobacter multimanifer TaxID=1070431 RepID=A0A841L116_9SPHN|nr:putative sulfate exporter family transporter [Polymorphobacter multimanifer]MBB6226367.1 putative integral membrane protein (TIGR00698 family) [Polymorphobacter multimanifer]
MPMQNNLPQGADLFGDIEPSPRVRARDNIPGLIVAGLATLAAAALASRYGAPLTLLALLIGLSLNFLSSDKRLAPGLGLAARELLRFAIVLIGARITFAQIGALGPEALAMVSVTVLATLGTGVVVARSLGLSPSRGVLAGGAVAICGGSAALALSATLGERRVSQSDVTLTLVGISIMSAAALMLYPVLALTLGLSDAQAGYFLGGSVHDVAQAVGAGYAFSEPAGETATIVKLARVALLAPVLALVGLAFPVRAEAGDEPDAKPAKAPLLPWFVVGFFVVAGINSLGFIPAVASTVAGNAATALLALSVAATAIRTPVADIMKAGPRPLIVIAASTLVTLALALGYAMLRID